MEDKESTPPKIDIPRSGMFAKEEDTVRARFLMSPYNIREAQRHKEMKYFLWSIGLATVIGAGVLLWFVLK
jgi:hypothetical protein